MDWRFCKTHGGSSAYLGVGAENVSELALALVPCGHHGKGEFISRGLEQSRQRRRGGHFSCLPEARCLPHCVPKIMVVMVEGLNIASWNVGDVGSQGPKF